MNNIYNTTIDDIRYYKHTIPNINDLVYSEILSYTDTGVTCYLKEYKLKGFMSYKELTNIKKLKNIKKYLKYKKYMVLCVISNDIQYIELSKKSVDLEDEKVFIEYLQLYEKIRKSLIKSFIWYHNPSIEKNEDMIVSFINDNLWNLNININTYKDYLNKFYQNKSFFSELINIDNQDFKINHTDILSSYIHEPMYIIIINLKINTLDLNGINTIILFINKLSDYLNLPIKYISGSNYQLTVTKAFQNKDLSSNYMMDIVNKINEFKYDSNIMFNIVNYETNSI